MKNLCFGEERLDIILPQINRVRFPGRLVLQELEQEFAHEPFIVADWRHPRDRAAKVDLGAPFRLRCRGRGDFRIEIDQELRLAGAVDILRPAVGRLARQLEVFDKKRLVINPACPVLEQAEVKDMRFQGIEGGSKVLRVVPDPFQPRLAFHRIKFQVGIGIGKQLAQPGDDEGVIVVKSRKTLRKRVELVGQQPGVDPILAKTAAFG